MRVAITGAAGQLGRQLVRAFAPVAEVLALTRDEIDLADPDAGRRLADARPDVVVNSAAWTDVDGCARDPERAMELNGVAPARLAAAVAGSGALFVQISTNEVFAGDASAAYDEDDEPRPINPYGASKLAGERGVAAATPRHLVVRTAWLFGPGGRNFATKILAAASAADEPLRVVDDELGNPTWTPALAEAIVAAVELATRGEAPSILHLAGQPAVTRHAWAARLLALRGLPPPRPVPGSTFIRPSKVPPRAVLSTDRAARLGLPGIDWEAALPAYVASLAVTA